MLKVQDPAVTLMQGLDHLYQNNVCKGSENPKQRELKVFLLLGFPLFVLKKFKKKPQELKVNCSKLWGENTHFKKNIKTIHYYLSHYHIS